MYDFLVRALCLLIRCCSSYSFLCVELVPELPPLTGSQCAICQYVRSSHVQYQTISEYITLSVVEVGKWTQRMHIQQGFLFSLPTYFPSSSSFCLLPSFSVSQVPAHWTAPATSPPTQLHTSPLFLRAGEAHIYTHAHTHRYVFGVHTENKVSESSR